MNEILTLINIVQKPKTKNNKPKIKMNKPFQQSTDTETETESETDTSKIFDIYSRSMKINEVNKYIIIQTIDEFSTNIDKLHDLKYIINDALLRHEKLSHFYKIKRDLQKCIQDLNDVNDYIDEKMEQLLNENFYLLK